MAKDIYTTVTSKIIEALESGVAPWVRPWSGNGLDTLPYNATSGRTYNGTNILLLWLSAAAKGYSNAGWLTYKQAVDAGGHVRKGEKATQIVFAATVTKENDQGEEERFPVLRWFSVFNVAQCEGLPESFTKPAEPAKPVEPIRLADAFIRSTGARINYGTGRAYYQPATDQIFVPLMSAFRTREDHYATTLHELGHWTGNEKRLARTFGKRFGDQAYAAEELVAELSAAFACARLGIAGKLQHAEYIKSWITLLTDHKRAIFTAAAAASKAVDYLFEQAGDYEASAYASPAQPEPIAEPVAATAKPIKAKPAKSERAKWYQAAARQHLRELSQGSVYSCDDVNDLIEYSRQVMARRGIDLGKRQPRYDQKAKRVVWSAKGQRNIGHDLPAHTFCWSPKVERVDYADDGSERRFDLLRGEWAETTYRKPVQPVPLPLAA